MACDCGANGSDFFGLDHCEPWTDRYLGGRNIAKSPDFLPYGHSFVGASVIWKFIYDFRTWW